MFASSRDSVSDIRLAQDQIQAAQNLFSGLLNYHFDFIHPMVLSGFYFGRAEYTKWLKKSNEDVVGSYLDLMALCIDLWGKGFTSSIEASSKYAIQTFNQMMLSLNDDNNTINSEVLKNIIFKQLETIHNVGKRLPQAIEEIKEEYGFHFERNAQSLVDETDRFYLYQVFPNDPSVKVDNKLKPILIIPPFVLGSNILCFLPEEKKSYAHSFADKGIPTYIRVMKDIETTPEFQVMTMEEETLDTLHFCEIIKKKHKQKLTLNGYCQGGYSAVCQLLSGKLDNVVDALITCVAPMDGTQSKGLGKYLKNLPQRFNDLSYGTKMMPNGNRVADGQLMGWVYKLKSIATEIPLVAFLKDMVMADHMIKKSGSISKTAAALNYWLKNERTDIPLEVTRASFLSYNVPVKDDGTLPVTLFDQPLNFKRIKEKKIPWLLCYGETDDLVEKETALAPSRFVDVEAVPYPKGHVAIATSWSHPESEYALHKRFGKNNEFRGPVRFQLDISSTVEKKPKTAAKKTAAKKPSSAKTKSVAEKKTAGQNKTSSKPKKKTLNPKKATKRKTATAKPKSEVKKPTAKKPVKKG